MNATIILKTPLVVHGEEVAELTLREPTSEDVMQIGTPTLLIPSADGESLGVEIRARVVGQYIMRLAAIPLSSVKALSIADFQQCTRVVMGFFGSGDSEA